ncbi:MAG: N-acetylmuramoyl-L-alanine amidase [Clostridia bacterium]|nr:N-acetylmuramoyl-L-alanine amidase [Clostridia bacterium]
MKLFTLKKGALIFIAVLAAFASLTGGICGKAAEARAAYTPTIVIDAGHGGVDAGVYGVKTKAKESDINLAIAIYLKGYFADAGFNAVMTRKTQAGLYGLPVRGFKKRDMQKRRQIIEDCDADMVISIHQNSASQRSRRGSQIYYNPDNLAGKSLAENIKNSIDCMNELVREADVLAGDYYMLECTSNPSVIVECGFLTNAEDDQLLNTEEYRKSIAYAIFRGAIAYLA